MSDSRKPELLASQLEIVEQARDFLTEVSLEQYNVIVNPHFTSSAGKHMRHILDHYFSVKDGLSSKQIDYDSRSRGSEIEVDPQVAIQCWNEIEIWLKRVCHDAEEIALTVKTEVSLSKQASMMCQSTLARELIFVASHAVHHFSLLSVIGSLQGVNLGESFGIAPATASHLRIMAS